LGAERDARGAYGYLAGSLGDGPSVEAQAFVQGLRELGYVEGRNLVIEYRDAGGKPDRLPTAAAELVALGVDVILAPGTEHVEAARQATRTIPIVFAGIVACGKEPVPRDLPDGAVRRRRRTHVVFAERARQLSPRSGIRRQDPQKREAGRLADRAIEQVRAGRQSQDCRCARHRGPAVLLQRADRVIDSSLGRRVARVR